MSTIWKHKVISVLLLQVTTDKHHLHNLKSYGADIIKSLNKLSKTARFVTHEGLSNHAWFSFVGKLPRWYNFFLVIDVYDYSKLFSTRPTTNLIADQNLQRKTRCVYYYLTPLQSFYCAVCRCVHTRQTSLSGPLCYFVSLPGKSCVCGQV